MEKEETVLTPPVPFQPKDEGTSTNRPPSNISRAEAFEKVNRKVFTVHDGLFRRLAEHDRQR
jgi:hypothetical protein